MYIYIMYIYIIYTEYNIPGINYFSFLKLIDNFGEGNFRFYRKVEHELQRVPIYCLKSSSAFQFPLLLSFFISMVHLL